MSNRDEEMFQKLKPILEEYRIRYQSSGDILTDLYNKIFYDDLRAKADLLAVVSEKEQRNALYHLKEESYERRIEDIMVQLKQRGLGKFQYDYDLEKARARKTEHKTRFEKVSAEVYHNELIRQLSDLPYGSEIINGRLYVKPSDSLVAARERYETLTGETWKIPKTTFKHEAVMLDNKIGKAVAEKGGVADEISALDPHYNYRSLAKRYSKASKVSSFVLSSFAEKQVSRLKTDVDILKSYEEQVERLRERGILTGDVKVSENLSVKDQIEQYRKILSGNVYDVADVAPSTTPALLDLVEHRKDSDRSLYNSTAKDLAGELQLSDRKAQYLSEKNVPLSAWKNIADDIATKKTEKKQELLTAPFDVFQKEWEDPRNRSLFGKIPVKKKDDTTAYIYDGIEHFDGKVYRTGVDSDKLQQDYDEKVAPVRDRIETARKKIVDIRQRQIEQLTSRKAELAQKGVDISSIEAMLQKRQQQKTFQETVSYEHEKIGSLDLRLAAVSYDADILSRKADIMSLDPAVNFSGLKGVKREEQLEQLNLLLHQTNNYSEAVNALKQRFKAPTVIDHKSLVDQLAWYDTAQKNVEHYDSLSQQEFDVEMQQASQRPAMPVDYARKIKGHYYRTDKDKELISALDNIREQRNIREQQILTGPTREQGPVMGQNRLAALFEQQNNKNIDMLQKVVEVSDSNNFSASYDVLTAEEKEYYNRNYGTPVKQDNVWYRSIFDMPDDVWAQAEKAAGHDVPRHRGGTAAVSVNVEEEKLQQEITKKLEQKVWEPVKKEIVKPINRTQPEIPAKERLAESPVTVTANEKLQQETKDNLRKMLTDKKNVKAGAVSSMGLMAAFYLTAAAGDAPSAAALEHRRRVEEERRAKKYGWQ